MNGRKLAAAALLVVVSAAGGTVAEAQSSTITLGPLACLPQGGNGVLNATVSPEVPGTTARLYFRRMNVTVEDFYWVEMEAAGGGGYWATFPVPTNDKADKKQLKNYSYEGQKIANNGKPWAEWWRAKEGSKGRNPNDDLKKEEIVEKASVGKNDRRDWLENMDDATLQAWLDRLTAEPAEYFVALVDGNNRVVARSEMRNVEVRNDCRVSLTPQQEGYAHNLTIGETAVWQAEDDVFHWECDGVVTRVNSTNVLRADNNCRACVIAWWPIVAAPAGAIAIVGIVQDGPIDVSPSRP
ncbi:MAG: hypothetical protein AB7G12_15815 [Thermoanaerobaculia bacterium]